MNPINRRSHKLFKRMPRGRLLLLPRGGHGSPLDCEQLWGNAVAAFFLEASPPDAGRFERSKN